MLEVMLILAMFGVAEASEGSASGVKRSILGWAFGLFCYGIVSTLLVYILGGRASIILIVVFSIWAIIDHHRNPAPFRKKRLKVKESIPWVYK